MAHDQAIESTSSGYHMFQRRQVGFAIVSGVLQVHEGGRSKTLTRADVRPIEWIGTGRSAPLVPLAALVIDAPGGEWLVSSTETTVVLAGAVQQATPAPHVWVSGDDLARMATACGIEVARREPWMPPPGNSIKSTLVIFGGIALLGVGLTLGAVFGPLKGRSNDQSCATQRAPEKELYPRLSCQDARAELEAVARGEAQPRGIVLRASSIVVDARDVKGPATITCDGIEFAVVDALQAAPEPISLGGEGPHSVLVETQTDGTLRVLQYCACCNVVRGERKGPKP